MPRTRWLIVGLGNPGKAYENTRHNAGFMAVELLSKRWNLAGKPQTKFNAMVGTGSVLLPDSTTVSIVLAQPTTYMNLSGEAVSKLCHYYQIEPKRILVIYDDVALPLGKLRIRSNGSAGGQNGMKSIIQHLGGCQDFPRLRIGIGLPEGQKGLTHHVLERFTPDERKQFDTVLDTVAEAVEVILAEGVENGMNQYNGQSG